MKYVTIYKPAADFMDKVPAHFDEHRALWHQFHEAGTLLMIGPFTDPAGGALGIFTTRAAAEEFVAMDPFVRHGVAETWEIQEWNEVLVP